MINGKDAIGTLEDLRQCIKAAPLTDEERAVALELADNLIRRCQSGTLPKLAMRTAMGSFADIQGTEACVEKLWIMAQP